MTIPPFVTIDQDPTANTATLRIEDKEVKQQREMWGKHASFRCSICISG